MKTETVGERITRLRIGLDLSKKQLASKAGVSPANITNWEQDRYGVSGKHLEGLASALKTTPSYILSGDKTVHEGVGGLERLRAAVDEIAPDLAEEDFQDAIDILILFSKKRQPKNQGTD